jgi:hypothetical protein
MSFQAAMKRDWNVPWVHSMDANSAAYREKSAKGQRGSFMVRANELSRRE